MHVKCQRTLTVYTCYLFSDLDNLTHLFSFTTYRPAVSRTVALSAEWAPADGKWEEKDYESELKKLEKEAEERLDAKIAEMMAKIETTGAN